MKSWTFWLAFTAGCVVLAPLVVLCAWLARLGRPDRAEGFVAR